MLISDIKGLLPIVDKVLLILITNEVLVVGVDDEMLTMAIVGGTLAL